MSTIPLDWFIFSVLSLIYPSVTTLIGAPSCSYKPKSNDSSFSTVTSFLKAALVVILKSTILRSFNTICTLGLKSTPTFGFKCSQIDLNDSMYSDCEGGVPRSQSSACGSFNGEPVALDLRVWF